MRNHPHQAQRSRYNNRGYVIDCKGNASTTRHICRIGDFLKIGRHRNVECEKHMVDDVKPGCQVGVFNEGICRENDNQSQVFDG